MSTPKLGIITNSIVQRLSGFEAQREELLDTPYGPPEGPLRYGRLAGESVVLISRREHANIAPHLINYRANIWALAQTKVTQVIGVISVGGIRSDMMMGAFAVPDQVIDYTHNRLDTFIDGRDIKLKQIDFCHPYDENLRQRILDAAAKLDVNCCEDGTCGVVQGPRFESLAEMKRLELDGCDMVGMTAMPETALAREAGLAYANIAVISDKAVGHRHGALPCERRENLALQVSRILQQMIGGTR